MRDAQRIVDDILALLRSPERAPSKRVGALAEAYAEICAEANVRLRRCEEFLQKGLRSEAMHFAQAEPDLLDLAAVLDFPERPGWESLLAGFRLPPPPVLLLATAEALNQAYSQVGPLEELLRRHRLLALARAPLAARLGVLRQIARADPANPVWGQDVRIFEAARVRQVEGEVEAALEAQDTRRLAALCREVRDTPWLGAAPLHLIERVERAARRHETRRALDTLRALEGEIHDAVAAGDVDLLRRLRERWLAELGNGRRGANRRAPEALKQGVAPAFAWLDEEERRLAAGRARQAAVRELQITLNDPAASPAELERLYRVVISSDAGVPDELETLYRARRAELRRSAARLRLLLAVSGAALGIALTAAVVYGIGQARREERINRAVRESRKQEDAAKEFNRRARFQSALQEARSAPRGEPGNAALEKARSLAHAPAEVAEVEQIARDQARQAEQDRLRTLDQFRTEREALRARIDELEKAAPARDAAAAFERLRSLQQELSRLKGTADIPAEMLESLNALGERLRAVQALLGKADRESRAAERLDELAQGSEAGTEYIEALRKYAADFASTRRGKAFPFVLPESSHWHAALQWDQLLKPLGARPLDVKPAEARVLADRIDALLKNHPEFVDGDVARTYRRALESIAEQNESVAESASAELRQLFNGEMIRDLWALTEGDRTYYLRKNPGPKIDAARRDGSAIVPIRYLTAEGKEEARNVPVARVGRVYRAPQSEVADLVQQMPPNFAGRSWESATIAIAQKVCDSADMDPLLQLHLLRQVLALASRGSLPLRRVLEEHRRIIQEAGVDLGVPWANPGGEAANRARPAAAQAVTKLPPFPPVLAAAAKVQQEIRDSVNATRRDVVGWLAWEEETGWHWRGRRPPSGLRTLLILAPESGGRAVWKRVGTLSDGKAAFDPGLECLAEGRLLFGDRPASTP
jgi:hypothetical protein